jgi:hypothetical protein
MVAMFMFMVFFMAVGVVMRDFWLRDDFVSSGLMASTSFETDQG